LGENKPVFCCTVSAAAGFLGIASQPPKGLTKPVNKKSQNAKYNRENFPVWLKSFGTHVRSTSLTP
jgi:hypothetical protein